MLTWPRRPIIYELNTGVWLHELSQREGRPVTLGSIPQGEWDALAALGIDAVWLMGVWERSPTGIRIAKENAALQAELRRVLPDLTPGDILGSPYCVRRYSADPQFGGPDGLAAARQQLARRGLRLILDFVPNHVAPDHLWIDEHPEYFIQGSKDDLKQKPGEFFKAARAIIAHGRDPYFPPWSDVAQLNVFNSGLRGAIVETVCEIAEQCDGMRCDMAMLLMNRIFERTWGPRAGPSPETDYWPELIQTVRTRHPGILFMAEAYWNLEWDLQQQGFDYCYDKRLYDRLEHDQAESVRLHLCADLDYQQKLVRFIENHDESRAAATFTPQEARAVAVATATLPGAVLLHQGQFAGKRIRLPVFLGRGPVEPTDQALETFYWGLLKALQTSSFKDGDWQLCERSGWPDNHNYLNLVAWCWRKGETRSLVIVNLSEWKSQGRVWIPWDDLERRTWRFADAFTEDVFERDGHEMRRAGLYVDLPPWGFHVWNA